MRSLLFAISPLARRKKAPWRGSQPCFISGRGARQPSPLTRFGVAPMSAAGHALIGASRLFRPRVRSCRSQLYVPLYGWTSDTPPPLRFCSPSKPVRPQLPKNLHHYIRGEQGALFPPRRRAAAPPRRHAARSGPGAVPDPPLPCLPGCPPDLSLPPWTRCRRPDGRRRAPGTPPVPCRAAAGPPPSSRRSPARRRAGRRAGAVGTAARAR